MDLTEAEDIKKRQQEYTKEVYKNDLNDPDNHDGVITPLEPDILKCEVKCSLESITMNKASGDNRIPAELFQILKDDAVKVLHSKLGKLQSGHRSGKGQFSFQSPKPNTPLIHRERDWQNNAPPAKASTSQPAEPVTTLAYEAKGS